MTQPYEPSSNMNKTQNMARPRKAQHTSTAKTGKKTNKPTIKDEHNILLSPPRKGLLDLPPELRNTIYRLVLVSNEPITLQCERVPGRNARHRFITTPALTLVSKQLRLETQRIFIEENEFLISPVILKQRSMAPLLALQRMHEDVDLELKTLHLSFEGKKRCDGILFSFTADLTLSVIEHRVTAVSQVYNARYIGRRSRRWPASYVPHVNVCGCRGQWFAEQFQAQPSGADDLVGCVQLLMWNDHGRPSYYVEDLSRSDEVVFHADFCLRCSENNNDADYYYF